MMQNKLNGKRLRSRPAIQSLDRGLQLLNYVVSSNKPVTLGELADLLKIEKSSAHRLMATLMSHGYAVQDSHKRYLPGPTIMELASKVSNRIQIHDIAGEFLSSLAEKTGETAHLAVFGRECLVLTDCVSSNHALAVTSRIGESEPLHCTALGKALICDMNQADLKKLLGDKKLKKYTDNTITSINSLFNECKQIRISWLAKDDQEFRKGVRCLASPVRNFTGQVIAAIGISGPKSRLNDKMFKQTGKLVKQMGIELSKKLGFV